MVFAFNHLNLYLQLQECMSQTIEPKDDSAKIYLKKYVINMYLVPSIILGVISGILLVVTATSS